MSPLEKQINQMQWTLDGDPNKPPEYMNVLLTVDGFSEAVIGARWKGEYYLINDFEQKYEGDSGTVKVIAWQYLPKIYIKPEIKVLRF